MASDQARRKSLVQGFDCESVPVATGTKTRARLPRDGESEPTRVRIEWLLAVAVAALVIGVLIGRFV